MEARSSQDFACCLFETASARLKYSCAIVASGLGDCSAISPAMRLASASNHVSLVLAIVSMASQMLRQASSNWPSSAYALPRYDECNGIQNAVPADRNAAMPEVILWTA